MRLPVPVGGSQVESPVAREEGDSGRPRWQLMPRGWEVGQAGIVRLEVLRILPSLVPEAFNEYTRSLRHCVRTKEGTGKPFVILLLVF